MLLLLLALFRTGVDDLFILSSFVWTQQTWEKGGGGSVPTFVAQSRGRGGCREPAERGGHHLLLLLTLWG